MLREEFVLDTWHNSGAAPFASLTDDEYKNEGATIYGSATEVLEKSQIILKVNCPSNDEINSIKDKSILIGQFDLLSDKEILNKLIKKNINIFSLNLLPRITRAQSMDVLSSQANLAGYRAVIESVEEFGKAVPMMMTAAGSIGSSTPGLTTRDSSPDGMRM